MVKQRQSLLATAALASTLLFVPTVQADYVINDEVVNLPVTTSTATAVGGPNVQITSTGQINISGIFATPSDALTVDTANTAITMAANNKVFGGPNAIITSSLVGPGGNDITITGASASVNLGAATNLQANGNAIAISGANAQINNSGNMYGYISTIQVNAGGSNAQLTNNAGAVLRDVPGGAASTSPVVQVGDTGFILNNAGTIDNSNSATPQPIILLNSTGAQINNVGTAGAATITQTVAGYPAIQINGSSNTIVNGGAVPNGGSILSKGAAKRIDSIAKATNAPGWILSGTASARYAPVAKHPE